MICQHYLPSSSKLAKYIAYFWTLRSEKNDNAHQSFHLVPDGYVDWIFHIDAPWEYSQSPHKSIKKKARSHLFGHASHYITMGLPAGQLSLFGIKFHPWAARQIWGIDMYESTNQNLSLNDINRPEYSHLEDKIQSASTTAQRIKIAESFFIKRQPKPLDQSLISTVRHLYHAVKLEEIHLSISQRRLEQRFRTEIGISPKLLQRTYRVNRVIQTLVQQPNLLLTDIAYRFDYFDQSHFIREFKQFTGTTPSKFQRSINPSEDILNLKVNE